MSEPTRRPSSRDLGMTLPELLISIVVMGIVAAVLAAGVSVTVRQQQSTQGRMDVAHWEQNLGMWLPDDLTSASAIDTDPMTAPCGSAVCTAGSNVIQMSWTNGGATTVVSYRYQPDGTSFGMFRVECVNGTCRSIRVLGDLSAPVDQNGAVITSWKPGDAIPVSIIKVDAPDAMDPAAPADQRQVSVTVNGNPAQDGVVRSSRVTIAAGGTELGTIAAPTFTPPSFDTAYSQCGGPITLLVDRSGSIDTQMGAVRTAVKAFVNAFEGTPTRLQIISFSDTSSTLGAVNGQWNKYYDMSEPGVAAAINKLVDKLNSDGATNWEDAIFRALNSRTGQPLATLNDPNAPLPDLVVLFTDGLPTTDRQAQRSDSAPTTMSIDPLYTGTGNQLSPRAWYRADRTRASSPRFVGVGVGSSFAKSTKVNGWSRTVPHEEFLGDLIADGLPSNATDNTYKAVRYNNGWGPDVGTADLLISSGTDFSKATEALEEIALATCGGTLTVQTRVQADGSSAPFDLTYEMESKQVVTSRFSKTGTFDVSVKGQTTKTVTLVPRAEQIAQAGYVPVGWACRAGGQPFSNFTRVSATNPAAGITITIRPNDAVSCTLEVRQ